MMARHVARGADHGWIEPLPGLLKRQIIHAELVRTHADILVETGTYMGDTPWYFRKKLAKIYTIEVEPSLARVAMDRFRNWGNVRVITGDSPSVFPTILPSLEGRVLFWLDGHYSAGITGKGAKECPLFDELEMIYKHCQCPKTILIDDFRLFGSDKAYPSIGELREYLRQYDMDIRWANDIIHVCKYGDIDSTRRDLNG